jgi:hypothetical protein
VSPQSKALTSKGETVILCDVPRDPLQAAAALAGVQNTQARFREVQEERRQAILAAVNADVPLREVAEAANISHETVRRIVAADGQVVIACDGDPYRLTGRQVEMLIYKLAGSAQGAFPGDIERLDAGTDWLPSAGKLAQQLQEAMADETGKPVKLDHTTGWALYLILRLTYFEGTSVLSRLFEALHTRYPDGAQHVIAAMQRARPRKAR